ncbi:hypothetical protein AAEP93_011186 [Penicillium crustosum]
MSSTRSPTELVSTTLREGISGYIDRTKLESRLYEFFGYKIETEYEIADLCEDERVDYG